MSDNRFPQGREKMDGIFLSCSGHWMRLNSIFMLADKSQIERNSAAEKSRLWREVNRVKIQRPKYVRYRSLSGCNLRLSLVCMGAPKYNATVPSMSGIVQRRRLMDVRRSSG